MWGLTVGELSVETPRFLVWQLEGWWPLWTLRMLVEGKIEWVEGGR